MGTQNEISRAFLACCKRVQIIRFVYIYFSLKEGQHNPTWKNKDRTSSFPDWTNFESKHFTRLLE